MGNGACRCRPIKISPHLLDAIVATEDFRFYQHHGVDWKAVIAAATHDVIARMPGAERAPSPCNSFASASPKPGRGPRKLLQAVRACQLDRQLTKPQILVEYLNRAPFGGNLVGAGAAWRDSGKPCRELSLGQAALLAGLPQNPNGFRPDRFPDRARSAAITCSTTCSPMA